MQIHELNNYTEDLGSSSYLAIDDGSDTGKVSAETLLAGPNSKIDQAQAELNARIDNIIAGGDAPSAAEVSDARLGANGVLYPSLGSAIRTQVAVLNSAISDLSIAGSNRLNMIALIPNEYVNTDGSVVSSTNFSATDFIPVTPGETIYWWSKRTDSMYYLFDARFLCAYDESKTAISASGGTFVAGTYTVPSGVSYIRLSISNTYLSQWSNFYVGTLTVDAAPTKYEPFSYSAINQPQVDQNSSDIESNRQIIDSITKKSSNLFDKNEITPNSYMTSNGTISPIGTLFITDYLPVSEGQQIFGWGENGNGYEAINFRMVCALDENKNPVPASGQDSDDTGIYTVPSGISYLRITLRNAYLDYNKLYIGIHAVGYEYEDYGLVINIPEQSEAVYTVRSGGSILEGVKYCYANDIPKLIIEAGTYDIIEEYENYYGADYFTNYTNYNTDLFDAGIWLHDIELVFSPGAKVTCKYTGANENVGRYFSAFATGNNVTIEGLVLDAENLRYGIHADFNTGSDETFFNVKKCDLRHYKNAASMQAIGAGFGQHVDWLIEDTIFRSSGANGIVFRVHNSVNSAAQSKLVVKDCYIDGDGYFLFNAYSNSTLMSIIQLCGCSYKTVPVVGRETPTSNDNFELISWNNEVRA